MALIDDIILEAKRSETAPARAVRDVYRWALRWNVPVNGVTRPVYAGAYRAYRALQEVRELAAAKLLWEPMARARFARVGRNLQLSALPFVVGHTRISIGDDCRLGYFSVQSGKYFDEPELHLGDGVVCSSFVKFIANRRVYIGNHVGIAAHCWISDTDGHPTAPDRRMRGEDLQTGEIAPVTIEDYAWIGHSAHVMKGVTVGRGAVVAAGSVVTRDVPAGALAMGVPARIARDPW